MSAGEPDGDASLSVASRRPWWVVPSIGGGVLLAIVAAVVLVIALSGNRGTAMPSASASATEPPHSQPASQAPTSEPSQTADPTTDPTSDPTPEPQPPSLTWETIPFDGLVGDVLGDGDRFVAVGNLRNIDATDTTAWTSADGRRWERHDVPDHNLMPSSEPPLWAAMGRLVRLGDTVYSFGGNQRIHSYLPIGFRWTDGGSWQLIQSASDFYAGGWVVDAAAGDGMLVALRAVPGGPLRVDDTWRWTPETSWERANLVGTHTDPVFMRGVAFSNGIFAAIGSTASEVPGQEMYEWPTEPGIWTSDDGLSWTEQAGPQAPTELCAIGSLGDRGFVVIGHGPDGEEIWRSADGSAWERAVVEGAPLDLDERRLTNCAVVAVTGGYLAIVGWNGATSQTWTSVDGSNWSTGATLETPVQAVASIGDFVLLTTLTDPAAPSAGTTIIRGTLEP